MRPYGVERNTRLVTHSCRKKALVLNVINIHTIKPLDEEAVLKSIRKTKCAVTAEEHNIIGGLGDGVAQVASKTFPCTHRIRGHQRCIR